jgi:hypothetical protein
MVTVAEAAQGATLMEDQQVDSAQLAGKAALPVMAAQVAVI